MAVGKSSVDVFQPTTYSEAYEHAAIGTNFAFLNLRCKASLSYFEMDDLDLHFFFFYSKRDSVSFARVISEKTGWEIENINKSHGGSCVKCRVKSPEVAPAATALRKQEIIQEVDTKKGM